MRRFFGEMGAGQAIPVPAGARYVTVGPVAVLPDVRAFNGGEPGDSPYGHDLGYLPKEYGQEIALLVLLPDRLAVAGAQGVRWSCDVTHVTALDAHRRGGFLVFTARAEGLAVGQQTPVPVPPGAGFTTISGMTNVFSGWDRALAPYGVPHHF